MEKKPMDFIMAANWKMNKGPDETKAFFQAFGPSPLETIFFVPSVNAPMAAQSGHPWGPQNIYPKACGAFTGETSPQVMASLGAKFCLIGHSERRGLFQETDPQVLEKVKAAQEFNLTPLICIGESLKERQAGATLKRLETQLSLGLQGVQISPNKDLYIAYEPLWAIGTGEVASPHQVEEVHGFVKNFLQDRFPHHPRKIPILYGGSVKPENAFKLSRVKGVGGFLVGGASLQVDSFKAIIKAIIKEVHT